VLVGFATCAIAIRSEVDSDAELDGPTLTADVAAMPQCQQSDLITPDVSVPYFAQQREAAQISTCTKQDVCLLMRQLDAAFYEKALAGDVGDVVLPQRTWVLTGRCAEHSRQSRLKPVWSFNKCKSEVQKHQGKAIEVKRIEEAKAGQYPQGCVIKTFNSEVKAYYNKWSSTAEAGLSYRKTNPDSRYSDTVRTQTSQLCELDVALDKASAYYYSPYKLKQSMMNKYAKMNTACSFGMMADLFNKQKTQSPCAEILAWRPNFDKKTFKSAADLMKAANENKGTAYADGLLEQVGKIRQKFVLISVLTNHWCPNTWKAAIGIPDSGPIPSTSCRAAREPAWVSNHHSPDDEGEAERVEIVLEKKEKKASILVQRKDKMSLTEATCQAITGDEDESLESLLAKAPPSPPDFFAAAFMDE